MRKIGKLTFESEREGVSIGDEWINVIEKYDVEKSHTKIIAIGP